MNIFECKSVKKRPKKEISWATLSTLLVLFMPLKTFGETLVNGSHDFEIQYYTVEAVSNLEDLMKQLSIYASRQGMETHGVTNTSFKWAFNGLVSKNGKCQASSIDVSAATVVKLPQLVRSSLSVSETQVWKQSFANLVDHEYQHYKNHQAAYAKLSKMALTYEAACEQFRKEMKKDFLSIVTSHKAVDVEIDAH